MTILVGNLVVDWFGIVKVGYLTFPAGVVFVGLTFCFRDFVQKYWGDWLSWIWMGLASVLTIFFNYQLAVASFCSFVLSEFIDWFIFKVSKLPFYKRIYLSNLVSCPLDSIVFVGLAFGFIWDAIWGQALIKYLSGFLILPFLFIKIKEKRMFDETR